MDAMSILALALAKRAGGGGGGSLEDFVLWAEYGITSFPEIQEAHSAGKVVLCEHLDRIYMLSEVKMLFCRFTCSVNGVEYTLTVDATSVITPAPSHQRSDGPSWSETSRKLNPNTIENDDDGDIEVVIAPGDIYLFTGELTSLTIDLDAVPDGWLPQYHFMFHTGSTPLDLAVDGVKFPDGFDESQLEADKEYEVDILNGNATVCCWDISQESDVK